MTDCHVQGHESACPARPLTSTTTRPVRAHTRSKPARQWVSECARAAVPAWRWWWLQSVIARCEQVFPHPRRLRAAGEARSAPPAIGMHSALPAWRCRGVGGHDRVLLHGASATRDIPRCLHGDDEVGGAIATHYPMHTHMATLPHSTHSARTHDRVS